MKFDLSKISSFQTTYIIEESIHGESKKMKVPAYIKQVGS
jgi:hypothetical protein